MTGAGIRKESTVNREMACLHHVFAKAVEWEMIEQSPFDRGKSLRLKENNKRLRYLSEEEIQRLLAQCPKYPRGVVECAIHTGMRKSEILGLRWDQIKNGCIYLEPEDTKTKEPRQVPINDDLRALLKETRAEQPVGTKYVFVFRKGEHRLTTGKRCRILNPIPERVKDVKTAFQNALKRACIDDFRFHDLRTYLREPTCHERRHPKRGAGDIGPHKHDYDHEVCALEPGKEEGGGQPA